MGFNPQSGESYCKYWIIQKYSFDVIDLYLMAHASIERYLLIFHRCTINRHIYLLHYLPITISIIYPVLWYIGVILIYRCENHFNREQLVCGGACYQFETFLGTFDWILNCTLPVVILTIVNIILIGRVLYMKSKMQRTWKSNLKMLVQLVSISLLYILTWLPYSVLGTISIFWTETIFNDIVFEYLGFLPYIVVLICPFVSLLGLPEMQERLHKWWYRKGHVVRPTQDTMNLPAVNTITHE
ncbi:unnamed protein product [Didymodactylos carnosus]|uniref:G-protein coupled receptors family 1 profile domain-containing protein n=1 Tax=Didymodactylos carnosus TaxID=1234261 RepID=A0A815Z8Z6_9BILA|nr:unnamed protein product [Didymodactylos carnosus]CAF4449111.1 unnamed protein product [Didymodactylos carnosus]